MNKFGLALALLALVAAPYSYALEIFSMDCNGGFRYFPSYPIGGQFDYSSFLGVADTFLSVYKDRLKCLCADLTDDEFNRLFHPFFGADMAFNIMQGPNADLSLSKCSWSAFDSVSWMRADKFDSKAVDLTSTCSYDTWTRDGKCMLQSQTFSDWDVTVKVGLFKCQSAPWRPAMSLICEGKGCEQAFIPCMSDSDCAGNMQCKEFIFNNMARPTTDDMLTAFKSILRADDLTSSCVNTNDIVRTTVDLIRKMWKQDSATYTSSQAKICSPIELNFWTNMTFNWEDLIHYTPSSVVTTNTSVSVPGYLQPWNGNLLSGGIMSAPQNVGAKPANVPSLTPGGTLIFQKSCDGTFTMLPSAAFGMSFDFGVSHTMIDHWVSIISPILKCRFQNLGLSIGDQEMRNRWGLGLDWLFFNVDADHARDSLTGNLLDYGLRLSSRVDLPSTCNYDSWVKEGLCRAQYTGLGDLLGVDATANIEVKKCGSSSDVSLTVECAGAACSLLSLKTKPCNSNSDCPNSLTCQDLNPKLGTYDWMNAYIGINGTKTPSCSRSPDAIHAEVRKLALSFLGMQYDGSSDNKYCMIDYDHVVSQGSTWAKGEVDTDSTPGVVKLKNLKAWDGSAGNTPVSSGVTTVLNYALGALAVVLAVFY